MKYKQTSARWGYVSLGKRSIGMTPNVYNSKKARVAYELGFLAGAKAENSRDLKIEKYESRRVKHELPLEPFRAGYREARGNRNDYKFGYGQDKSEEKVLDCVEMFEMHRRNPFSLRDYNWNEEGVCLGARPGKPKEEL